MAPASFKPASTRALARSSWIYLLAATVTFAAACGDDEIKGSFAEGIKTTVTPSTVMAGEAATVGCELIGATKAAKDTPLTFTVTPDVDVEIADMRLIATRAGLYTVHCEALALNLRDDVGAGLTVVAGPAVAVRPVLDDNPIAAGVRTGVRCASVDRYGNVVDAAGEVRAEDEAVHFADGKVWSDAAGTYALHCESAANPDLPRETTDLVVIPGGPAQVTLRATPERDYYTIGAQTTLVWDVTDAHGNAVPALPGTISAPADAAITLVDAATHKYRLGAEGRYTFRVTLDPPHQHLTDSLTLTVDQTAPEVVITWPPRGATIEGTSGAVVVEGYVTEGFAGLSTFIINDKPVTVAADNTFTHTVNGVWGVNLLRIVAEDAAGNQTSLTPTYMYSSSFTPFVDTDARGLAHADGMTVLLGQAFLDDGVHDHGHLNDVATILEVLIGEVDLATPISDALAGVNQTIPIASFQEDWGIDSVTWLEVGFHGDLVILAEAASTTDIGQTTVAIDSRQGGVDLDVTIGAGAASALDVDIEVSAVLSFDITVDACSFFGCDNVMNTTASGSAILYSGVSLEELLLTVHTDISKLADGPLEIDFRDFNAELVGLDIDPIRDVVFNLGVVNFPLLGNQQLTFPLSDLVDLNALLGSVIDPVVDAITAIAPQLLNPLVEGFAGPLLAGVFDAIAIDSAFPLPPLFGGAPVAEHTMDFYADLSTVAFTELGGTVGMSTGVYSEKIVDREPLGAIVRDGCLIGASDELAWSWQRSVGLGILTDVINAGFYGAWQTGYLNGQVDPSLLLGGGSSIPIPINGLEVTLEWYLPPMVNDCMKSNLNAQIGDLRVTLSGDIGGSPVSATLFADLGLRVTFVVDDGGLSVELGELLFNDFEVVALEQGNIGIDLRALIEDGLPALLSGFLVGQRFGPFELPATDLSQTVPGLPPGTTIGIGNLGVIDENGHVIISGDLQ